jgi:hypothetical protein
MKEPAMKRFSTALLGLIGACFICGSLSASAQPKEPVLPEGQWPQFAKGLGETQERAKDVAYREAVNRIHTLMRLNEPPLESFKVDRAYVEKHLLVDTGRPGEDVKMKLDGIGEVLFKEWILTFRTDYNWWKDIVRRDLEAQREVRGQERQAISFAAMIVIAALLLVSFGYVRLDEYTNRRYTTWLRIAGVGALSSAVVGGWWVLNS